MSDFESRPVFMRWCNEIQWNNMKNYDLSAYNPKSANYIPSHLDHNLSEDEWNDLSSEDQDELNRRFTEGGRARRSKRIKNRAENIINKATEHWYNTLSHDDIVSAIEKTRKLGDQVIDFINEKESLPSLRKRNEELKGKVKFHDIKVRPVEIKKLRRFPKYNPLTNELIFSNHSIMALWIHVFSTKM